MEPASPSSVFVPLASGSSDLPGISLYAAIVLALIVVILLLTWWLGQNKPNAVKCSPYESGIIPSGSARFPYPAPFYLVAIFFLGHLMHGTLRENRKKSHNKN